MAKTHQSRINLVIGLIGTGVFLVVSVITIFWAAGWKFEGLTKGFEQTSVIAINNSNNGVTVMLNNQVVGNATPLTLSNLAGGNYNLELTKPGFYPFQEFFQLTPGQAAVVKDAELIAENPQISADPSATYLMRDAFDVGLSYNADGELLDYGNLVTRFSSPIVQAHRFNNDYLYQQNNELHLYFPASNQDFVVYKSTSADLIKLNLSFGDWSVVTFDGSVPQQVFFTQPSGQTAG